MKFHCPHCNQKLVGNPALAGRSVPCPNCNKSIVVPEDDGEPAAGGKKTVTIRSSATAKTPVTRPPAGKEVDATNVNTLLAGLIGLALTTPFYLSLLAFKGSYLHALFWQRGWIPAMEALLMFWSIGFLILKWRKVKKQQRGMLFDLLPDDIAEEITADNVDLFIAHVEKLPVKAHESFLISRVVRGLEHFRVRESNPEVASVLSSHSDTDANTMQASYSLLKVFIWAIPILGFIGTVQGLGSAVGGFSEGLGKAEDLSVLKDSLSTITVGLAVAFDTTLIALVMSVLLMFPMSSMQKAEEDLISRIDDYCNENLLKRLRERAAPGAAAAAGDPGALDAIQQAHAQVAANAVESAKAFGDLAARLETQLASLNQAIQKAINEAGIRQSASEKVVADSVKDSTRALKEHFEALRSDMKAVDETLKSLEARGLTPARRGWRLFRRT